MTEIWEEPPRGQFVPPEFYSLPGMDRVRLMRQVGIRSPQLRLLGSVMTQSGPGSATITVPITGWLAASTGWIDPIFVADNAMQGAVETVLPPATSSRVAHIYINYIRPVMIRTGNLTARGRTIHVGRMFGIAQAEVEDGSGNVVAHAVGRYHQIPVVPPPPPMPAESPTIAETKYDTPDPYMRAPTGKVARPEEIGRWAGLEVARKRIDSGENLGPMQRLLGSRMVAVDEGTCTTTMPVTGWLLNANHEVMGGLIAPLAHGAMYGAVRTAALPDEFFRTADFRIDFVGELQPDGRELTAVGKVMHKDGESAVASCEVFNAEGNLVALAGFRSIRIPTDSLAFRGAEDADSVLATVLFTDIVGSTQQASEMGDRAWKELLDRHHGAVREAVKQHRGTEIKTVGDGFIVTFESPARAVRCARAIRDAVAKFGVKIRAGLHTGEIEMAEGDIGGLGVHIAARVIGKAGDGEILVSSTVRDLVTGSDLEFSERGVHELKGVKGEWRLYALEG